MGRPAFLRKSILAVLLVACSSEGGTDKHPDEKFLISSGDHAHLACDTCHLASLGSPAGGQNTSCIGCHSHARNLVDSSHLGIADYAWDDRKPHFCLTCHPDGLGGTHSNVAFPISSGAHANIACTYCHDRTLGPSYSGGRNVNCTGCHTGQHSRALMDQAHLTTAPSYAWSETNKVFCRQCHSTGTLD